MTCVVVIQARSGSSRLPAKALLDFHGLPLIVIAARRARRTGLKVVVATSVDPSDDMLAATLMRHEIPVFRGSLQNVLGRFVDAIAGLPDDTAVVRLTGDNIVPDGSLIDEAVAYFERLGLQYLSTTDAKSGLPYGVSIEVARAGHLRQANIAAETSFDREHVTPYIARKFGRHVFDRYAGLNMAHYRTTVDSLDDFLSLDRVFGPDADPVETNWLNLVERAGFGLYQPSGPSPASQMVLGGAQLGMSYGIANTSQTDDAERIEMIKTAIGEGVAALDTAAAYGRSEAVIGMALSAGWAGRCPVVTKLSPLANLSPDASVELAAAAAENSVIASCLALRQQRLDTLLLHRASHIDAWHGAVWNALRQMRQSGRIGVLGVSVQSPTELEQALRVGDIGHIQLPCNILDHRWDEVVNTLRDVRKQRKLTVHVRSALLQGLLASRDPGHWARAHVGAPQAIQAWLTDQASGAGRASVADLCLAYVRSLDWTDALVVGCDNLNQLQSNVALFRTPPLTADAIDAIVRDRPIVSENTLNPAKWATGH